MISKKRVLSVAAAVALSSSMASAGYLPLTGVNNDNNWVMFGVAGFHSDGASAGGTGAVDAGMFTITDTADNVAIDTGGDELYGEDSATVGDQAMLKGGDATKVLGNIKRVDGVASSVQARVNVSAIAYQETDPVRTIYVKIDADAATPIFAFSYKSALEGERLEFSTNISSANDNAYFITIDSENTYSNPAMAQRVPANDGAGADDGTQLKSVEDMVDYDLIEDKATTGFNPTNSAFYLKDDHQNVAGTNENLRLYSYNPSGIWNIYDSRNTFNDFTELEKGKGYWGRMDQATNTNPSGLVLGAPTINTQDYIDSGIAPGWNLLAFNGINPDLRVATTGLIVPLAATGDITLTDVSGNHSVDITLSSTTATIAAREINQAMKEAKLKGEMPDTFNIVAIPTAAASIALISNEKFTFTEVTDAVVTADILTLAGVAPLNAVTLLPHAGGGTEYVAASPAMSKYGEYALVVRPENDTYAQLDIKCDADSSTLVLPTVVGIGGAANCIEEAYSLDADFSGNATDDLILMTATAPFEVRDHTFTRVFDYAADASAGELTFVNAGALTTADILPAINEIQTLTITADGVDDADEGLDITYGTNATGGTATISVDLSGIDVLVPTTIAAQVVSVLNANGGFDALATATNNLGVVTITYDGTAAGVNINTQVTALATGTVNTLAGVGATSQNGISSPTAQEIVTDIDGQGVSLTDTANILADGSQILFRSVAAGTNEFQVLETGVADNLTPATSSSTLAKGAISDVFTPNYFTKVALKNTVSFTITDVGAADLVAGQTIPITVNTPLGDFDLGSYLVDSADQNDAAVFYQKFRTWVNEKLLENYLDTTMTVTHTAGAADYSATVTFTGSDITNVSIFTLPAAAADVSHAGATITLGTPNVRKGDLEEDLKYNYVLSPNYVLNGPLYEMNAAGYKALAMVTGTMSYTGGTVNWDGIDLTRKPSEWLLSQDYNLFTVDPKAGYWTFLEPAEANPLSFEATTFSGNYTQHFDVDGKTYNQVAGGIEVTVNGISDYDDRKSARVVAIVGGSEVELSQDGAGSNVYTGQISSRELKELVAGEEHDIQIVIADGLGNRIPATSSGSVVDFKKPTTPVLAFTDGSSFSLTNLVTDGVTKYYVYNTTATPGNQIPATSAEASKLLTITPEQAGAYNICATPSLSRNSTYTLKLFALDGADLENSNASDVVTIANYMPLFKNSAIVTNTKAAGAATTGIAEVKYTSACEIDAAFAGDTSMQLSSLTDGITAKVAYVPKITGNAVMITAHVSGGAANNRVARITYHPDYVGDTVFVQIGTRVYSYELPDAPTAVASTESSPIDISDINFDGTYLPGQSLGN